MAYWLIYHNGWVNKKSWIAAVKNMLVQSPLETIWQNDWKLLRKVKRKPNNSPNKKIAKSLSSKGSHNSKENFYFITGGVSITNAPKLQLLPKGREKLSGYNTNTNTNNVYSNLLQRMLNYRFIFYISKNYRRKKGKNCTKCIKLQTSKNSMYITMIIILKLK